jgi:competence protein ComEC
VPTPEPTLPPVVNRASNREAWSQYRLTAGAPLLQVVFPAIHDADSALILCGGEAFLIDCADHAQEQEVVTMLRRMGVKKLKAVLITHPHHDHLEGFAAVAAAVEVEELLICFPEDENDRMAILMQEAEAARVPVRHFSDGDVFTIGDATLEIFLKADDSCSVNDRSGAAMLRWHGRSLLFAGDLEKDGMNALVSGVPVGTLKADLLKFPHHAVNNVHSAFISLVDPALCIVTNRDRNTAGEQGLKLRGIPYVCTRYGGLILTTDGERWLVERLIVNWRGGLALDPAV